MGSGYVQIVEKGSGASTRRKRSGVVFEALGILANEVEWVKYTIYDIEKYIHVYIYIHTYTYTCV